MPYLFRSRWLRPLLVAQILFVYTVCEAHAADPIAGEKPARKALPEALTFESTDTPLGLKTPKDPISYSLTNFLAGIDTKFYLSIYDRGNAGVAFYYQWHANEGDILPILGVVYRVTIAKATNRFDTELHMRRVTEKSILRDVAVEPGNVTVLQNSSISLGRFYPDYTIGVTTISGENGKAMPTAELHVAHHLQYVSANQVDVAQGNIVGRVGDKVAVENYTFTVTKIVVPDKQRKIVGWVELSVADFPPETLAFSAAGKEKSASSLLEIPHAHYHLESTSDDAAIKIRLTGDLAEIAGAKNGISVEDCWKTTASGGDVLPLFGYMYKMLPLETKTGTTQIAMRRVGAKDIPPDTIVDPTNVTLLFDSKLRFSVSNSCSDTLELVRATKDPSPGVGSSASIRTRHCSEGSAIDVKEFNVKINGSFALGEHLFRVVNIVPPDRKNKLVGWIELNHDKKDTSPEQK